MDPFNLLWDLRQQSQIHQLQGDVGMLKGKTDRLSMHAETKLIHDDRIVLLLVSLGELLIEKGVITTEMLTQKVLEKDMMDGHLNGRIQLAPTPCPHCQCAISRTFKKCLMCGYIPEVMDELETIT